MFNEVQQDSCTTQQTTINIARFECGKEHLAQMDQHHY